jgi:hypothetical protein
MKIKLIVELNKESRKLRGYDCRDFLSTFALVRLKILVKSVVSLSVKEKCILNLARFEESVLLGYDTMSLGSWFPTF